MNPLPHHILNHTKKYRHAKPPVILKPSAHDKELCKGGIFNKITHLNAQNMKCYKQTVKRYDPNTII